MRKNEEIQGGAGIQVIALRPARGVNRSVARAPFPPDEVLRL